MSPNHHGMAPCHKQPGRQGWHLACALVHPARYITSRWGSDQAHGVAIAALTVALLALSVVAIPTMSPRLAIAGAVVAAAILLVSAHWDSVRGRATRRNSYASVEVLAHILYEENPDTHPHSMEKYMLARQQAEKIVKRMGPA